MASYAINQSQELQPLSGDAGLSESTSPQRETGRALGRCADAIVSTLMAAGIDRMFGLPGGPISPVFHAAQSRTLDVVGCCHEGTAAFAAAGYGRATGTHGVLVVTSGPGVLNALNAIAAAHADDSNLLVLVGEVATANSGRGVLQDGSPDGLNMANVVSSVCSHVETVRHASRVAASVEQALQRSGVTVLLLPVDILLSPAPATRAPVRLDRSARPDPSAFEPVVQEIEAAARPVLFAGRGARKPGVAEALTVLAEKLRAPVVTDMEGKAALDEAHPLSLGLVDGSAMARKAVAESDLVITIGTRLDDFSTVGFSCPHLDAAIIQIDEDDRRIGRAYSPRALLVGDLVATLEGIGSGLADVSLETIVERDLWVRGLQSARPDAAHSTLDFGPHDPRDVVAVLGERFAGATFVCDIGNHSLFASRGLRLGHPDQFFTSLGTASMGSGIGHAIGMAMGSDEQVVCICGDGGFLMAGNEISTCVARRIPLIFAVFHDKALGMVAHGESRVYGETDGWVLPKLDLTSFGRSLGAYAARLDSYADLVAALEGWDRSGPLLLDIPIDPTVQAENPRDAAVTSRLASAE